MNRSRNMSWACRALALLAVFFGTMVASSLPAYGQQEVNPTWYDPWAAPNPVVVHSSQPQVAIHRHQAALKRVSTAPDARKFRGKRPTTTEAVLTRLAK